MGNIFSTVMGCGIFDIAQIIFSDKSLKAPKDDSFFRILDRQKDRKCADLSRYHLDEGHYYLTSESTKSSPLLAVEKYTKSLMHAPTNSLELNRAYAARSVALFNSKLITPSLTDINRVSLINYPDQLKAELLYGKALCYQILYPSNVDEIIEAFKEVEKWIPHLNEEDQEKMRNKIKDRQVAVLIDRDELIEEIDPEMISPKWKPEYLTLYPGLSDDVDLKFTRDHGRYLVAKSDLKDGQIIAVQVHRPYVKIIRPESAYEFCWNCGKKSWSSVPCHECTRVIFCSDNCREIAWLEYHDIECQIIQAIIQLKTGDELDDYCIYGSIKLTIRAVKETEYCFEELKENIDRIHNDDKEPDSEELDPKKYMRLFVMSSHVDRFGDMKKYSDIFKKVACLLASDTDLFARSDAAAGTEALEESERFIFLMNLIQINFVITKNNSIFFGKRDKKLHMIVPAINLFNETCENIDDQPEDNRIGIVVVKDISEGEKIQLREDCVAKFYPVEQACIDDELNYT